MDIDETLIACIGQDIWNEEMQTTILHATRLRQLQFSYTVLRYLTQEKPVKVSYKLYEPFKTMGSISAEGRELSFDKPEWFARAAEFADNTELYPLANGNVRLTFTFHNLTVPLK